MTDSANSASALYSGHKGSARSMGVETIVERVTRILGMHWDAATTANLNGATPASLFSHTRSRSNYGPIIDQILNGITKYTLNEYVGPEASFGGGAEAFLLGDISCSVTSPTWARTTTVNLLKRATVSAGTSLKEMTSNAIEITHARSQEKGGDKRFFLMIEASSIDKQMHALDYDRALGDLLELNDTISKTMEQLNKMGILDETEIIVTADHGHSFDKRNAIGVYGHSGESQYTKPVAGISYGTGPNFPMGWEPQYAMAAGMADGKKQVYANPQDSINGILINGTLPAVIAYSAHSMTDVPVFARSPCQNEFGGVYNNVDVFYKIAKCLGLGTKYTDDAQEDSQYATGRAADRF
ncbi:Alkaline phosphatase [Ceratocystis fimbriata CBS 114723]|uniref:alkaline phosphatase n=1 Tax=Ceratocystis fimbriata CBS 114723 TaxID=1035309 RepID=A0A2C5X1R5_9PEZI|nr:Alkaline phosphatase [Ceratocystis fimbriata CBS 114723]